MSTRFHDDLLPNKEVHQPAERILTIVEASAFLRISKSYLYKLSAQRKVPSYSPLNGKIYFLKSELESWILNSKRVSKVEMEQEAITLLKKGGKR